MDFHKVLSKKFSRNLSKVLMQEQKIAWVEHLRGMAILAVVLGHISNPMQAFIFTWHMPMFFMISGFFIDYKKSDIEFIISLSKRLIPIYFIAMILGFGAEYLKNILLDRSQINIVSKIFIASVSMDYNALKNSYGFVLWFLPALFWAKVFLYYMKKYLKSSILVWTGGILSLQLSLKTDIPLGLDEGLFVLLFVIAGNYIYKILNILPRSSIVILLLVLLSLYSCLHFLFGFANTDLASKSMSPLFLGICQSFCLCAAIILTSYLAPLRIKFLKMISGMSFMIFILHPYTNNIAHLIALELFNDSWVMKFLASVTLLYLTKVCVVDRVLQRTAQ